MKIVVIGHGMVGSRFVEEAVRRAPTVTGGLDITVLGEEPYEPYNRLMLSEVIAGRAELSMLTLPAAPPGVDVRQGIAAREIDRARRVVVDALGEEHPYDLAVLATGAEPALPAVPGVRAASGQGVRAVRTIDDCRELLAACSSRRHMTVLGGGLLGVEIACGLRTRGVEVTLVHRGGHLMDRQLDAPSGAMAAATLRDLGVEVRLGSGIVRVQRVKGQLAGVELADGEVLATDQLIANTGVRPRVSLAKDAGVPVDIGVLVDSGLRAIDDESIAAIGDCAQTSAGCPGLIAPGWDQAAHLARTLGPAPMTTGPRGVDEDDVVASSDDGRVEPVAAPTEALSIVKLKAVGLDVVALGAPLPDPFVAQKQGVRIVTLSDAADRRSVTVGVRDGRIVGANVVGSPRVAADLTSAYERGTPLPRDPAHLLMKGGTASGAVPEVSTPKDIPNAATVCRCNGVTKKQIVDAHLEGNRDVAAVAQQTRATTGCGGCRNTVCGILEWMDEVDPVSA